MQFCASPDATTVEVVKCDLMDGAEVRRIIAEFRPHVVVRRLALA